MILHNSLKKWNGHICTDMEECQSIPSAHNKNQNKHTFKDYKDLRGNPPLLTKVGGGECNWGDGQGVL